MQVILEIRDDRDWDVLQPLLERLKISFNLSKNGHRVEAANQVPPKRKYGFAKGLTLFVAPDFDETPPGFEE